MSEASPSKKRRYQTVKKTKCSVHPCHPPFLLEFKNGESTSRETYLEERLEAVAQLLKGRKNIVVLVGAGVSVSCGIPDFRSKGVGLYETLDTEVIFGACCVQKRRSFRLTPVLPIPCRPLDFRVQKSFSI